MREANDSLEALLGQAADEFTDCLNRGQTPDLDDLARRYPAIADVVRDVLPALEALRHSAPATPKPDGSAVPRQLGDFRILREIGRGGMGVVYEAEQISLQRRVALKVFPFHPALDARHLARFQREADTAARLHHTNIVPVWAVGCEHNVHFYAMQLIDGESVDRLIAAMRDSVANGLSLGDVQANQASALVDALTRRAGALTRRAGGVSPPRNRHSPELFRGANAPRSPEPYFLAAARMGIQVAEALDYAHQRGVIHRDIKPSNLILDAAGIVWITDFGLVKSLESGDGDLTRTGDVVGTARYMSPEQALAKKVPLDQRTDIYALGVTLYELLTLRPACDGGDHEAVLKQLAMEEPIAPRQHNPAVPRDLETIVLKAMAHSPQQRYRTAGELAADLRRFAAGEPILARPMPAWERAWLWAQRRPAVAVLLGIVLLVSLSGFALVTWQWLEAVAARGQADANAAAERRAREEAEAAQELAEQQKLQAEERERIARRHLYAASLHLTQQAWERGHVAPMRQLLAGLRPQPGQEDLRGFEWHYLWRLCHRDRLTLAGHSHVVAAVAFSPDGKLLATTSEEGDQKRSVVVVKLWDSASGAERGVLRGHLGQVRSVAFAPDGKTLASASLDRTVKLWDVATGETLAALGHGTEVLCVVFDPDSKSLASGSRDGTVKVWDLADRRERLLLLAHGEPVWSLAFSPDGTTLASASGDRSIKLWDPVSGDLLNVLQRHADAVRCVAFTPDGTALASGSADETVKLWDVASGKEKTALKGHLDPVTALAFSPDGKLLASGGGDAFNPLQPQRIRFPFSSARAKPGEIKLWNVANGLEQATFKGHAAPVQCLAFAPDGHSLASGGDDMTAIVWNVTDLPPASLSGHVSEVNSVAFSPDGKTLASVSDDRALKLWDLARGQEKATLKGHTGPIKFVVFAPDGRSFATGAGDRTIRLWDARTGEQFAVLTGHQLTLRSLAFSPDGRTLASAAGDFATQVARPGEVKLWDLATRQVRADLKGHAEAVRSVAFSPDGRRLATGSDDRTVKLWDAATGQELATWKGHTDLVRSVAFSPNGKTLASASNDRTVILWDVVVGKVRAILRGHRDNVLNVVYAPDGRTMLTGSSDGTVKFWDPVTGQERAVLEGHRGSIRAIAFSPDGKTLATGDNDSLVKLWYAASD